MFELEKLSVSSFSSCSSPETDWIAKHPKKIIRNIEKTTILKFVELIQPVLKDQFIFFIPCKSMIGLYINFKEIIVFYFLMRINKNIFITSLEK
jgi:hypothetical protein